MRGLPDERDLERRQGEHHWVDLVPVARMEHERGVDLGEDACLQKADLSVAALLGRTADESDATACSVERVPRGQERPDRRRADEVVAAAVAETGEGVIFPEDRHEVAAIACLGDEGRLEATRVPPHHRLLPLEVGAKRVGCITLLERQLGMCVDLEGQPVELARARVDALGDTCLRLAGTHVRRG